MGFHITKLTITPKLGTNISQKTFVGKQCPSHNNKEQWEDVFSYNSLAKTLTLTQLGTAIECQNSQQ